MGMQSILKALSLFVGALAALFAIAGACFYFLVADSMCGNELLSEAISPNGAMKAVVFQRDCGATSGLSTQVSVLKASATIENASGNTFTADTNRGAAPSGPGGGPAVSVRWASPQTLVVSHHPGARVFTARSTVQEINVRFEPIAP
jgi:hypothetical protein